MTVVPEFRVTGTTPSGARQACFGVQFNQTVYAKTAAGTPPVYPQLDLEAKVKELAPQFVRVMFDPSEELGDAAVPVARAALNALSADPTTYLGSFRRVLQLAQEIPAVTINITAASVDRYLQDPDAGMQEFANVLEWLVDDCGIGGLRWVTLQNEPNSTRYVTPPVLNQMYTLLDRYLTQQQIRSQIQFMCGDLLNMPNTAETPPPSVLPALAGVALEPVDCGDPNAAAVWENPEYEASRQFWSGTYVGGTRVAGQKGTHTAEEYWFQYMQAQMKSTLLDAFSIHAYWSLGEGPPVGRLKKVREIVGEKRAFVMEYGVNNPVPPLASQSAAFEHAWFQILAAQNGYAGTAKWECYFGPQNGGPFWAIGDPGDGSTWPLYPKYYVLWLFTHATRAGWRTVEVEPNPANPPASAKLVAGFAPEQGPGLSILGLCTSALDPAGGGWAPGQAPTQTYSIATGLPQGVTSLNLLVWNLDGLGGLDRELPNVGGGRTGFTFSEGVAEFTVPSRSVFALTTLPLTLPPQA